jgi:exosortase
LSLLHAGALGLLGLKFYRQLAFPLWFLVFAVPMPTPVTEHITVFLQHGSADAAQAFLGLSGIPMLRSGTVFQLPGFAMEVARECSGIHSTLALFITSVLAGYVLLQAKSRRWLLALAVVPLALLRNALRIFTIGQLCVLIDPEIVNTFIHKRGGPIFFLFSLIPFLLLLVFLKRSESGQRARTGAPISPGL